jgi:hypothetical protein
MMKLLPAGLLLAAALPSVSLAADANPSELKGTMTIENGTLTAKFVAAAASPEKKISCNEEWSGYLAAHKQCLTTKKCGELWNGYLVNYNKCRDSKAPDIPKELTRGDYRKNMHECLKGLGSDDAGC